MDPVSRTDLLLHFGIEESGRATAGTVEPRRSILSKFIVKSALTVP